MSLTKKAMEHRCVKLTPLQWRHNGRDGVSNHQPHDCLLKRLFRWRSKKISKLRVTGLCVGNSPVTGKFPAQMASNAENVSIWWRHHANWKYHGNTSSRKYLLDLVTFVILKPEYSGKLDQHQRTSDTHRQTAPTGLIAAIKRCNTAWVFLRIQIAHGSCFIVLSISDTKSNHEAFALPCIGWYFEKIA